MFLAVHVVLTMLLAIFQVSGGYDHDIVCFFIWLVIHPWYCLLEWRFWPWICLLYFPFDRWFWQCFILVLTMVLSLVLTLVLTVFHFTGDLPLHCRFFIWPVNHAMKLSSFKNFTGGSSFSWWFFIIPFVVQNIRLSAIFNQ